MNTPQFKWYCIIAFLAPIAYQRFKFYFLRHTFEELSMIRRLTGLNIHHGHWGLLILVLAGMWNATFMPHPLTTISFYLGFGLVADEIVPLLKMPSKNRELELSVYSESLCDTAGLAGIMAIVIFALFCVR